MFAGKCSLKPSFQMLNVVPISHGTLKDRSSEIIEMLEGKHVDIIVGVYAEGSFSVLEG